MAEESKAKTHGVIEKLRTLETKLLLEVGEKSAVRIADGEIGNRAAHYINGSPRPVSGIAERIKDAIAKKLAKDLKSDIQTESLADRKEDIKERTEQKFEGKLHPTSDMAKILSSPLGQAIDGLVFSDSLSGHAQAIDVKTNDPPVNTPKEPMLHQPLTRKP